MCNRGQVAARLTTGKQGIMDINTFTMYSSPLMLFLSRSVSESHHAHSGKLNNPETFRTGTMTIPVRLCSQLKLVNSRAEGLVTKSD